MKVFLLLFISALAFGSTKAVPEWTDEQVEQMSAEDLRHVVESYVAVIEDLEIRLQNRTEIKKANGTVYKIAREAKDYSKWGAMSGTAAFLFGSVADVVESGIHKVFRLGLPEAKVNAKLAGAGVGILALSATVYATAWAIDKLGDREVELTQERLDQIKTVLEKTKASLQKAKEILGQKLATAQEL